MRIGQVIGKTVMSVQDAALVGARWLVVSPLDSAQLTDPFPSPIPIDDLCIAIFDSIDYHP